LQSSPPKSLAAEAELFNSKLEVGLREDVADEETLNELQAEFPRLKDFDADI
jgi:hypothetical protein